MKHSVNKDDTLYAISKGYYKVGALWRLLAVVNRKRNPHQIEIGERIIVPFRKETRK